MSELRGVIISHAALAQALVSAVGAITGVDGALLAVSNDGCDSGALSARIIEAVGAGPAVLFVDLPGGSCPTSPVPLAQGKADLGVVTGVNLAMLLHVGVHPAVTPAAAARRRPHPRGE